MDKKLMKTALAVILGLSIFVMLAETVSLLFNGVLANDIALVTSVSEKTETTIAYIKNTSIALVCLLVPTLVVYGFAFFARAKKAFYLLAAGLSLFLAATCFGFFFDLRAIQIDMLNATAYAAAAEYFTELLSVALPALLLCAYFTTIAVRAFLTTRAANQPVAEVETNEEA